VYKTWQNPYHMLYHPRPISSHVLFSRILLTMFYTLYYIFKQESIQGRGTIKGRGMIKGRHLALYQIFKATVFTTKYMINAVIRHIVIIRKYFVCISYITHTISPVYNISHINCITCHILVSVRILKPTEIYIKTIIC
jgi:hypothetical protein